MTFLNPLVLIGLAAASIPLILHLLNLRKPRTIEFSTLAFLKELQQTSIRRLKLRQLLLLILRTALIVLIVIAFARPALRGSMFGTIGSHARTSVIILLDNTFSMTAADEHGTLFRQAQEKASQVLHMLREGDEAALVRFSDLPDATMETMSHDFTRLENVVRESRLSATSASLETALRISAKLLTASRNANKELYLLSDMQRTQAEEKVSSAPEHLFHPETKLFVVDFGTGKVDNVAVDSVGIVSSIFEEGKPLTLTARVANYGNAALKDYVVSAYLDGQRIAQRNVDVPPWGFASTMFTIVPKKSGFVTGCISVEEDAVEQDNRRWFTLHIPENITVVLVASSREDTRFVALPLTTQTTESGLFSVQQITPQQFSLLDLSRVDVLVLSNVPALSTTDAQRIASFVREGGGIVWFPGDAVDEANHNATLFSLLQIPPVEEMPTDSEAGLVFQNIDVDHPLFQGMFEPTDGRRERLFNSVSSIESPAIVKSVRHQPGREGRTIISLSNHLPFLIEYHRGDGLVFLFSSAPVLSWNDFPVKGLFAPLIHRAVQYAANRPAKATTVTVGDAPTVTLTRSAARISRRSSTNRFTLVSPTDDQEILQPHVRSTAVGSAISFSLKKLSEPGVYNIRNDRETIAAVAVNIAPRESDLRKGPADDHRHVFEALGISPSHIVQTTSGDHLEEVILQSRFGVELWKFFLIAALFVACAEMMVARQPRERPIHLPSAERPT